MNNSGPDCALLIDKWDVAGIGRMHFSHFCPALTGPQCCRRKVSRALLLTGECPETGVTWQGLGRAKRPGSWACYGSLSASLVLPAVSWDPKHLEAGPPLFSHGDKRIQRKFCGRNHTKFPAPRVCRSMIWTSGLLCYYYQSTINYYDNYLIGTSDYLC